MTGATLVREAPAGSAAEERSAARPILIIEDEPALCETLDYALTREGFRVVLASDGVTGLERFRTENPGLILLDLMLPTLPGLDVCRIIRAQSNVPIVILTAKDSEADKVSGLEIGADDYVTKPFSMRELVSRLRAHLRRAEMGADQPEAQVLSGGPVELDVSNHEVRVRGERVDLTPKEFDLLENFLRGQSRLRTRNNLIDAVWGVNYFGDTKTLDVHVKRLRAKIERDPHNPEYLVTVRGLGYRFLHRGEDGRALEGASLAVRSLTATISAEPARRPPM
jgi:two-component system, OmpR family, response regulator RegX3